jgi:hypothetical protein
MTWAERLAALPAGTRVVVRYRIEGGFTDALGELVTADRRTCTVATRRGEVVIDGASIVAAKPVPPPPARRQRRSGDPAAPGADPA